MHWDEKIKLSNPIQMLKGQYVVLEKKFKLRIKNEVIMQTRCAQNTLLQLERWQGPPHRVKQYEIVLSFNISLFIQS